MIETTKLDVWTRNLTCGDMLEALISVVPVAVFAVDAQRDIVAWNDAAEALLGYRARDVLGGNCLVANRCRQCMSGCGIAEHGVVDGVPLRLFSKSGDEVRVRKYAKAFFDEQGVFNGGIEVLVPDTTVNPPVALGEAFGTVVVFHGLTSADPGMLQVFQTIRNVAETTATTLVRGESGTGKELVARALHAESARRSGPFVAVNCAALTPSLMESELFGHIKGAFTGAVQNRAGIFEQAHRGTLFLDEVAELPLALQAKLLRVLEGSELVRVGSETSIAVDVRVIAATHRSLRAEVKANRFREDLMYRLRVVPIFIPALRERRNDVELLLWRFIGRLNTGRHRVIDRIAPDAMRKLLDHHWPGNVRELKNVVEYAFAVGRGPKLALTDLPPEFRENSAELDVPACALVLDEEARILAALEATGGHIGKAAKMLGMSRPTLWRKRRKYGISVMGARE